MAVITKYYLMEQVRSMLAGGDPSAGAKFEPRMVMAHLAQVINKKLKLEYLSVTLPSDETIPEGLVVASYNNVAVEKYKNKYSRAKLPAMPVSLRRGMGVWFVGPAVSNLYIATPTLTAISTNPYNVNLVWSAVPNSTSYFIERDTNPIFSSPTAVYIGSSLLFTDTIVFPSTVYYYRVTAKAANYNDSGYGTANVTTLPIIIIKIFDNSFNYTFN